MSGRAIVRTQVSHTPHPALLIFPCPPHRSLPRLCFQIDSLADGQDFYTQISRARFEQLCSSLIQRCIDPVAKVLQDAGMEKGAVHEVVLVGGMFCSPAVER